MAECVGRMVESDLEFTVIFLPVFDRERLFTRERVCVVFKSVLAILEVHEVVREHQESDSAASKDSTHDVGIAALLAHNFLVGSITHARRANRNRIYLHSLQTSHKKKQTQS